MAQRPRTVSFLAGIHPQKLPDPVGSILYKHKRLPQDTILHVDSELEGVAAALALDDLSFGVTVGGMQLRSWSSFAEESNRKIVQAQMGELSEFAHIAARCGSWKCWLSGRYISGGKLVVAVPDDLMPPPNEAPKSSLIEFMERLGNHLGHFPFFARADMGMSQQLFEAYVRGGGKIHGNTFDPEVGKRTASSVVGGLLEAYRFFNGPKATIQGKPIVVLGAAGRIGMEAVKLFAAHGAHVIASDTDKQLARKEIQETLRPLTQSFCNLEDGLSTPAELLCSAGPPGHLGEKQLKMIRCPLVGGSANDILEWPHLYDLGYDMTVLPGAVLTAASMSHPDGSDVPSTDEAFMKSAEIVRGVLNRKTVTNQFLESQGIKINTFQAMILEADERKNECLARASAKASITSLRELVVPSPEKNLADLLVRDPVLESFDGLTGNIGIFGGTFDPIHQAHLFAARAAYRSHNLERVIFMPTKFNPLKQHRPKAQQDDRLSMISLALQEDPEFFVSPYEMRLGTKNPMAHTLEYIRRHVDPQAKLFLIIGADVLPSMPEWKFFNRIFKVATVVTVTRDKPKAEWLKSVQGKYSDEELAEIDRNFVEIDPVDLSSSMLRERFAQGSLERSGLPPLVEAYIRAQQLYQAEPRGDAK